MRADCGSVGGKRARVVAECGDARFGIARAGAAGRFFDFASAQTHGTALTVTDEEMLRGERAGVARRNFCGAGGAATVARREAGGVRLD